MKRRSNFKIAWLLTYWAMTNMLKFCKPIQADIILDTRKRPIILVLEIFNSDILDMAKKSISKGMVMRSIAILKIAVVAIFCLPVSATIINIPNDYGTIQEGLDTSIYRDTVPVQPGLIATAISLFTCGISFAAYVSSIVWGECDPAGNPNEVICDLVVPDDSALTINPGIGYKVSQITWSNRSL